MTDARRHRGPSPKDPIVFDTVHFPKLECAARELAWLLDRGYPDKPSLQLVGNHHLLHRRQREALQRVVCTRAQAASRRAKSCSIAGRKVAIDGFNLLINIETALSGGVLVRGFDGWIRNLAAMHGSYRLVRETQPAIDLALSVLARCEEVHWYLDQPVSNCGRLAGLLREKGCRVSLKDDVDAALIDLARRNRTDETTRWVIATADSVILDHVDDAVDLVDPIIANRPDTWLLDFSKTRMLELDPTNRT